MTAPDTLHPPLGDRLRRLALWADNIAPERQWIAAQAIDATAVLLADLCTRTSDDPLVAQLNRREDDQ